MALEEKNILGVNLYQNVRKDQLLERTSSEIADSGKILDLDSLEEDETTIMIDLSYEIKDDKRSLYFGAEENKIKSSGASSDYTGKLLLKLQYKQFFKVDTFDIHLILGIHFRQRYAVSKDPTEVLTSS